MNLKHCRPVMINTWRVVKMHSGRCKKLHHCQRVSAFYFYTLSFYPLFTISKEGEDSAKNIDIINYFCKSENIVLKLFVVVLLL